mmetsp:Transcript_92407/g.258232  ORF Transcript_92407/g.258232 Transcript_92407/m.258232 type:complete len:353 (-) Transcript_92407:216-1274(-)
MTSMRNACMRSRMLYGFSNFGGNIASALFFASNSSSVYRTPKAPGWIKTLNPPCPSGTNSNTSGWRFRMSSNFSFLKWLSFLIRATLKSKPSLDTAVSWPRYCSAACRRARAISFSKRSSRSFTAANVGVHTKSMYKPRLFMPGGGCVVVFAFFFLAAAAEAGSAYNSAHSCLSGLGPSISSAIWRSGSTTDAGGEAEPSDGSAIIGGNPPMSPPPMVVPPMVAPPMAARALPPPMAAMALSIELPPPMAAMPLMEPVAPPMAARAASPANAASMSFAAWLMLATTLTAGTPSWGSKDCAARVNWMQRWPAAFGVSWNKSGRSESTTFRPVAFFMRSSLALACRSPHAFLMP